MLILSAAVVLLAGVIGWAFYEISFWVVKLDYELQYPLLAYLTDPTDLKPSPPPSITNEPSKTLSIVIPAYNEQDRLSLTLDETISYLQRRRDKVGPNFTYEIIIVDDGSSDDTVRVGFEYVKRYGFDAVRILRLTRNQGKGHAVRRGMMICRGELCLLMDADGATRVADLELLEQELRRVVVPPREPLSSTSPFTFRGPIGGAFGSRAHMEAAALARRSPPRRLLARGFYMLVLIVAGGRIRDTQCGFKLFTRAAAAMLFSNMRLQRWCFDVELVYLANALGVPLCEVPVTWTEMPGSKIRFTSVLHMFYEMIMLKLAYQVFGLWKVRQTPDLTAPAPAPTPAG